MTGLQLKGEEVYRAGIANYYISKENIPRVFKDLRNELTYSRDPKYTIDDVMGRYHQGAKIRTIENEEDIRFIFNSKSLEEVFEKLEQNKSNPFFAKVKAALE